MRTQLFSLCLALGSLGFSPSSTWAAKSTVIAPSSQHKTVRMGPFESASMVKAASDFTFEVTGPTWIRLRIRTPKALGKSPVGISITHQSGSQVQLSDPMSRIRPRSRGYPLGRDYGFELSTGQHTLTVRNSSSKSVMLAETISAEPKDIAILTFDIPTPATKTKTKPVEVHRAPEPPPDAPSASPEALAHTSTLIVHELSTISRSSERQLKLGLAPTNHGKSTLTSRLLDESIINAAAGQSLSLVDYRTLDARVQEQLATGELDGSMPGIDHMVQTTLIENRDGASEVTVRVVKVETGAVLGQFRLAITEPKDDTLTQESKGLRAALRRLGDQVAHALDGLDGEARYQQFAVLHFEEIGTQTQAQQLGLLVSAELTTALVREHRLMVVERQQMESILNEMALGQTGLISAQDAVEVGKLAGAQAMVIGSVAQAGDRFLVNSRVVATATGEVLVAEQASLPAADLVALSSEAVVLRTRSGAVFRSTLIPGWGQFYNREPMKGATYLIAELSLAGLALTAHPQGKELASSYYNMTNDSDDDFNQVRLDAENHYAWRDRFVLMALGVHAINVLDAFIFGKSFDSAAISAMPSQGGGVMAWRLTF